MTLYGVQGDIPFEVTSETSEAAARSIDPDTLGRLEHLVYSMLLQKPSTDDAIEAITGIAHQTISARRRTLVMKDLVMDSGQVAKTRQNRNATVWRIKTAADRAHEQEPYLPGLR